MPDEHTNHSIIYTKHTNHNIIYIKHTYHKSGTMIQIMVQNMDTNSSATQNKDKKKGSIQTQGYKSGTHEHKSITLQHLLLMLSLSVKSSLPLFVFREQKNSLKS